MTRLTVAVLCLLAAAHAQTIVGPNAGSTVLSIPLSTATTASDSWLTIVPGPQSQAIAYTANPNPNARIATVTAAGVKYPIVQASATGILTPWGPLGYGNIRTIAGVALTGFSGDNGPAAAARLDNPQGIAVDANANVYIADTNNNRIRKINAATGIITTIAGNGATGYNGDNIPATTATLALPQGIALDPAGNLYIADFYNNRIRKVTAATGLISTVGSVVAPARIAITPNADLILTSFADSYLRRLNPTTGAITIIVGNGIPGLPGGVPSLPGNGDGGPAAMAQLNNPQGVAVDPAGNIYIADIYNYRIRKINTAGIISTIAGTGVEGFAGDNGPATAAQFSGTGGLAIGPDGNLYIGDRVNQRIRRINLSTGIITSLAGAGPIGVGDLRGDGGPATDAWLKLPVDLALDPAGNVYSCEFVIRFIDRTSPVLAISPASPTVPATAGSGAITVTPTPSTAPWFATTPAPWLTLSQTGTTLNYTYTANPSATPRSAVVRVNTDSILITQQGSAASLTPATATVLATAGSGLLNLAVSPPAPWTATSSAPWLTVSPTSGTAGTALTYTYTQNTSSVARTATIQVAGRTFTLTQPATSGAYTAWGSSGLGTAKPVGAPTGVPYSVAVDANGNIYYADNPNNAISRIDATPAATTTTLAGANVVNSPYGLAVDFAGNLYVADAGSSRILKRDATTGVFTPLIGNGALNRPLGVAVDAYGNLYIADTSNHRIRRYDAATGLLTTIAGNGTQGFNGDFPNPLDAQLSGPYGIAIDAAGNIVFSEYFTHRVRRISASTGALVTILDPSQVKNPRGLAVDRTGNVYVADFGNSRVLKLNSATSQTEVVPLNRGAQPQPAQPQPIDVAVDANGNLYIADTNFRQILVIDNSSPAMTLTPSAPNTLTVSPSLPGAYWTITSDASWVTLSTSAGSGVGAVTYTATPNNTFAPRTATISAGATTFTINQPASTITFNPPVAIVQPTAGAGSVGLTFSAQGQWGASSSNSSWLTQTNAGNPLTYAFTANTGSYGRMATLYAGAYPFTVVQPSANGTVSPWGPTAFGNIETIAGNGDPAVLNQPQAVAVDANGNLYIADVGNSRIRKVDATTRQATTLVTTATTPCCLAVFGSQLYFADANGIHSVDANNANVSTVRPIGTVTAIAVDRFGRLYYAAGNTISTLDGGPLATGYSAYGLAVDLAGNLFFSDTFNNRVYRRDAITGTITNIVGNGTAGFSGEGGLGIFARLYLPRGLAVDRDGNLYIADPGNYRVRKLSASTGLITTVAGLSSSGSSGDGGPAVSAQLQQITGLALDGAGNLYIAGNQDNRIRFIDYVSPPPVLSRTFTIPAPATGRVYFVLNPDAATPANSCHGFFDRATNSVTLYNDALTAFAPSLQNSQCSVSNVSSTPTDFTMTLTRRGTYATGSQTLFTWAVPGNNGWQPFATWPIGGPALPTVVATAPTTANTLSQTFTVDARNTNRLYFLLNANSSIPTGTCHGYYDRTTNFAFLYNDPLTGIAEGLENSQCALTAVTNVGDTVTFTLTRRGTYATGNKNLYLWAVGRPGTGEGTGWLPAATWNLAPVFSPLVQTFTFPIPFSGRLYFLLNATPNILANTCHGFYDQPSNAMSLYNDGLTALNGNLQNSQCGISNVSANADSVTFTLTRQGSFASGNLTLYTWSNGWVPAATWGLSPSITGTTPANATQLSQPFSFSVQGTERLYFLVNPNSSIPANTCHGYWDRATNRAYLYNDALTALDPTLQNSQCAITNVSASGGTINLTITRKGTYATGSQNLYLWAVGLPGTGNGTGWVNAATWNLAGPALPTVVSASPVQSSTASESFLLTVRNTTRLYFLIYNAPLIFQNTCHGFFDVAENKVYLYNDALTGLLGPISPGTPGSVQNGQCAVATTNELAGLNNNGDLTVRLNITRRGSYAAGNLSLYGWAINAATNGAGWQLLTPWNVP
jgi:sugar lactone lactonase YvrE